MMVRKDGWQEKKTIVSLPNENLEVQKNDGFISWLVCNKYITGFLCIPAQWNGKSRKPMSPFVCCGKRKTNVLYVVLVSLELDDNHLE